MIQHRLLSVCLILGLILLFPICADAQTLTNTQKVGKQIFFDKNLSINKNQSCASCHDPAWGFTGPDPAINNAGSVYEGSIRGRFGNRKPPTSAYATQSPVFFLKKPGTFTGGNFWDGRATGEKLGNPAADQAQGPFLNPLEQALPDSACVVNRVCTGAYAADFKNVYGAGACNIQWPANIARVCASTTAGMVMLSPADRKTSDATYDKIALAIADYEASPESNAFSSKYDAYLAKKATLTAKENEGMQLYAGKAKCARCHPHTPKSAKDRALFTDYTYDNLGIPMNPANPFYRMTEFNPLGRLWVDFGLGGFLKTYPKYASFADANMGLQKVPTLRNVDLRPGHPARAIKAYGHNGYFKSLKEIVHFYNTRDVLPTCAHGSTGEKITCWPLPEVPQNVNDKELGNLGLTAAEEDAIVAFLMTLSDGYKP